MTAPTAVAVRNVSKNYGDVAALRDLDFTIEQGEFFGLLGPNGAGKSTLINALAGLIRTDRGRLEIMGHDVVSDYRRSRRALGVVPQELVYDPFFTARESLRFQAGYFGLGAEVNAWVDELLDALDLTAKANTNMRALSGGMKRRVLIGQALVHKPPVVVLDEPTAGVDVELRRQLWRFIRRLHAEGHTIVLTTHYLEEAEELCDRIAIVDRGSLVALDSKRELLRRGIGCTLYVHADSVIAEVPAALEAKARSLHENVLELRLNRTSDSVMAVLDQVRAAGITIADLHVEQDDLEDVFVQLTGGPRE